ncbi:hypothetical protein HDU85_004301 [Gaertneriomyces sp. JEL0708]|nr:hypothetical protein HDU85_004301 [Gaertneriomyces sp. JEL0708]
MAHSVDEPLVEYVMEPIEEDGEKDTLYTVTWKHTGETLKVRTKNSVYHGKGLFCAQEMIPAGSFIDHYHGITMSSATAHIRHPEIDDSFSVYSSDVIIPHKYIPGRFANDSVKLPENDQDPIIRTQEVNAAFEEIESGTVVIHALRDIHEGEEILISYGDWYWRGVMFERAGFEDAPTRFDVLTTPQDFARQKRWMKVCGWTTMPEDVRIVKVFRKDGRPHPDYYLLKAVSVLSFIRTKRLEHMVHTTSTPCWSLLVPGAESRGEDVIDVLMLCACIMEMLK